MKNIFLKLHFEIENDAIRLVSFKTALIKFFIDKGYYFDVKKHLMDLFDSFTLNHILSLWAGRDIRLLDEGRIGLDPQEIKRILQILSDEDFSLREESELFICEIFQLIYESDKKTYEFYEYAIDVLRDDIKMEDKIIDPFCGSGIFLSGIYDALMHAYYKSDGNLPIEKIHEQLLTQNIYGYDQSNISCAISILTLALKNKEFIYCKNIICCDILKDSDLGPAHFDWIISDLTSKNHTEISDEQTNLKNADELSLRRFESAQHLLNENGKLIGVFDNELLYLDVFKKLRHQILTDQSILKVFDFAKNDSSESSSEPPVIFYLQKGFKREHLFEVMKTSENRDDQISNFSQNMRSVMVLQDDLNEIRFDFYDQRQTRLLNRIYALCPNTLEDFLHFFQGIISGCDKAFVVHDNSLIYSQCIEECGVPWIKGKDITDHINFYGQYLLYTNHSDGIDNFPLTKKRLEMYKSLLSKRRECIKGVRQWYELQWGREKELFLNEKILFAAKSKKNHFIVDGQGYFFSADIYGASVLSAFKDQVDLKSLALLLNSDIYEWYIKTALKQINNGMYAYYPDKLKKIRIPSLNVISSFKDEEDINQYFGFNIARKDK